MFIQTLAQPAIKLAALTLCFVSMANAAQMRYLNSQLTSLGLTTPSTAATESVCVSTCNATVGCSAVSYSSSTQQCVMSMCANLKLSTNTSWVTISLNLLMRENCDMPVPRLEWMLTDKCGNSNTGSAPGVPDMQPSSSVNNTPSASVYFGKAYMGTNNNQLTCWIAAQSDALDYDFTQSYTIFSYFYFSKDTPAFPFLSFQYKNTTGSSVSSGPAFGYYNGLYYDIGSTSIKTLTCPATGNCSGSVAYNRTNSWVPVAMVYDSVYSTLAVYAGGTQILSKSIYASVRSSGLQLKCNYATAACLDPLTLSGSIFCVKFFGTALTSLQVANVANSCLYGKVSAT